MTKGEGHTGRVLSSGALWAGQVQDEATCAGYVIRGKTRCAEYGPRSGASSGRACSLRRTARIGMRNAAEVRLAEFPGQQSGRIVLRTRLALRPSVTSPLQRTAARQNSIRAAGGSPARSVTRIEIVDETFRAHTSTSNASHACFQRLPDGPIRSVAPSISAGTRTGRANARPQRSAESELGYGDGAAVEVMTTTCARVGSEVTEQPECSRAAGRAMLYRSRACGLLRRIAAADRSRSAETGG